VLINITGGHDLTLFEVHEAAEMIRGEVDEDANIIVGSALDPALDGVVRVSVVATGVDAVSRSERPNRFAESVAPEPVASATAPVLELGVHEKAEAEARAAYADYGFQDDDEGQLDAVAVNAPPPFDARNTGYPPRVQGGRAESVSTPRSELRADPAPNVAVAPTPVPETPAASSNRRPFGLWGRKSRRPVATPEPRQPKPVTDSGDLFGGDADDELEIPSFLRMQNR
jgi:cell division protein FtsZ